ncbi:MAG: DNA polymerase III subunit delta [Armatimonadetes bacterium]|nr:DNA polymerase III subunit delta [Armatimonadota bacterium]MCX7967979.1 DNA polymerase III subunit delta [Armatimonadota bacterium]MDW8142407.1 DNA polymerase III subunit delta [Armatimonadota bacterium]
MPYLLFPQEAQFFRNVRKALAQLYQSARYGNLKSPVIVVFGEDEFLVQRVIQRLTDLLLPEGERQTAITVLEGKEATEAEFAQALFEPTFGFQLTRRRLIIVKSPAFLKEQGKRKRESVAWYQFLQRVPEGTYVLFALTEPPTNSQLNLLNEVALLVPLSRLRAQDLPDFVQMLAEQAAIHIDKVALQELIDRVGNDARQLAAEIEKLSLYIGVDGRVTVDIVRELVPSLAMDVFALMNAVVDGDAPKAFKMLDGLIQRRENPMLILYLLARQFRFLLQGRILLDSKLISPALLHARADAFRQQLERIPEEVKQLLPEDHRLNLLKQSPSVIRNFLLQARNFSREQIVDALKLILETDIGFKTGIDQGQQLALLILNLCRLKNGVKQF